GRRARAAPGRVLGGGEPLVGLEHHRRGRGRLEHRPEYLVMALPAAPAALQPDFFQVLLAGDLEEALGGPQPDGPGRGVDCGEGAVEELLVELGWRQVRAGELRG